MSICVWSLSLWAGLVLLRTYCGLDPLSCATAVCLPLSEKVRFTNYISSCCLYTLNSETFSVKLNHTGLTIFAN